MTSVEKLIIKNYSKVVNEFEKYNKELLQAIKERDFQQITKLSSKLESINAKLELLEELKEEIEENI